MGIPRNVQEEIEKRDEIILAMEMLMVDQACRLLALEAVIASMREVRDVKPADVKSRIVQESKRFHQHFEGEGMSGFIERAQRIAKDLSKSPKVRNSTKKGEKRADKRSTTRKPATNKLQK